MIGSMPTMISIVLPPTETSTPVEGGSIPLPNMPSDTSGVMRSAGMTRLVGSDANVSAYISLRRASAYGPLCPCCCNKE